MAEQPQTQGYSLPLFVGSYGEVRVIGLRQRELRKELGLLQRVAQGLVMAPVSAANADQAEVPILAGNLGHQDVCIHEPVRRYLLHHHGQ